MAAPPSPRERAVLGLTWARRGLLGFLVLSLATVAFLVVLTFAYDLPSPTESQQGQLVNLLTLFSAILLVLEVISGLAYAVGLAGLYGPRKELGEIHAVSVERTRLWLGVTMVLLGAGVIVPSLTGPLLGFPGIGYIPPSWSWSVSVMLAGLRAIFAGLTLYYAVQGLAEEDERVRLLLGMTLGVAGAIAWSGLAAYAQGAGGPSLGSLLPFLAGAFAGLGTSAISLGLFAAVYGEIQQTLQAPPATHA